MRLLLTVFFGTLPAFANTITGASLSGFETTTVTGTATAFYFGDTSQDPAFISAGAHANGITLGPIRNGFIQISGTSGGEFGYGSGDVDGYSFICTTSCSPAGSLNGSIRPFLLGVPFTVDVHAYASNSLQGQGSGSISFSFSVFEGISFGPSITFVGPKLTIFDPPDVPEPSTFVGVGLGLAALAAAGLSRKP